MEGVAFAFADCLAALKAAGTNVERATAVGGGSRSRAWLKIIANVLNMPIDVPADGDFGGALGAARLGLIAAEGADPVAVCTPPKIQRDRSSPNAARSTPIAPHYRATARSIPPSRRLYVMRPASSAIRSPSATRGRRAAIPSPSATTTRTGRCSASGWRTISASPSATGTPSPGRAPTRSAGRPSSAPGSATAWRSAKLKADVAFEMFELLGVPFFTFHDRDIAPEGATLAESRTATSARSPTSSRKKMQKAKVKLLWGTANLFSNRRYMAGAATNPDPDVFAYAAAQVKNALDVTHELGGANYVLWGGREGYETLLNTDMKRELDQLGRFLTMVVEHKEKIGFKGTILIEPKPKEPTKHQYDFDVGTIYGMLKAYDLEKKVKINIEQNHAILAGHSFEHEIAARRARSASSARST